MNPINWIHIEVQPVRFTESPRGTNTAGTGSHAENVLATYSTNIDHNVPGLRAQVKAGFSGLSSATSNLHRPLF